MTIHTSRVTAIAAVDPDAPGRVRRLVDLAGRGLARAYLPEEDGFAQTVRAIPGRRDLEVRPEGENLRYAAMALLGTARLPLAEQCRILSGRIAADQAVLVAKRADHPGDPGAAALAAWAAAEVAGTFAKPLFDRWRVILDEGRPVPTLDLAWLLTAAVVANPLGKTADLVERASALLLRHEGRGATYPHVVPPSAKRWWRAHVGSFADNVYSVQALARAATLTGDPTLLSSANRTAGQLCRLQGPAGQWWWHYDARDGSVVEPYPVYSVHQHAMGPMVMFDLLEAGGDDHRAEVAAGLAWLDRHPEVVHELISDRFDLVWRKVGRREPRKAARVIAAAATSLRPGASVPGLDRWLPATVVDHECRPYELGWLLHAWLPPAAEGNDG